jgi:lipopolysaccharide biosynthesis glycosyltransferase
MKRAICITCSEGYFYFLTALLKSIVKNSDYRDDIVIFSDHFETSGTGYYETTLRDIYKNIKFHHVNEELYIKNGKCRRTFWALEVFKMREYDKVLYLGADMLCMRNFNEIFDIPCKISMVREERRRDTLNSGAMLISKELMTDDIYDKIISTNYPDDLYPEITGTDQRLFYIFFKDIVTTHHHKYNVMVTDGNAQDYEQPDVVFLHYFLKPNSPDFKKRCGQKLLDLWYNTNNAEVAF